MYGFKKWLHNLVYYKYGIDALEKFMLFVYIVIAICTVFVRNLIFRNIIFSVQWLLFVLIVLRYFSKNHAARRRENKVYEKLTRRIPKFNMLKARIRDIKYKRYRTCPKCRAVLRLPVKHGRHTVTCPACGNIFKVFIAF